MRKASQDGGDSTSITSGFENEMKKSGPGILKSTKNSIKRKVQNFSHESDDTANEPLLLKNKEVRPKELTEIERQSAKFLLSKTKTDYVNEKGNDKDKLLADDKIEKPSITDVTGITDAPISNGLKDKAKVTSQSISAKSIHNHMNTNVFNSSSAPITAVVAKTQMLVELETSKPSGYSPSSLIFTTAKIHTDGKIHQMEPVQVTPVPILSTIESGIVKTETRMIEIENSSHQFKDKKNIAATAPVTQVASISKLPEKLDVQATSKERFTNPTTANAFSKTFENNDSISENKAKAAQNASDIISSKNTVPPISNISKTFTEDSIEKQHGESSSQNKANKVGAIKIQDSQQVAKSNDTYKLVKKDFTNTTPNAATSSIDKNDVDVNKNFQPQPKQDVANQTETKKPGHNFVTLPPSTGTISTKGPCSKDDKNTKDSIANTKENKTGNSQENNIINSKVKSPDKEQTVTVSSAKPSNEAQSIDRGNTLKSPENSVSHMGASVPKALTSSSTNPSVNKVPAKEPEVNINKNTSKVKHNESISTSKGNTANTLESSISKTDSPQPSNVKPSIQVNSIQAIKNTGKEPNTPIKPSSDKKTTPVTTSTGTKSSKMSSVSISPHPPSTSSIKSVTSVNNAPLANNITKTMVSAPTADLSKPSARSISSSISPTVVTAENTSSKCKSNNTATVVSSISKPTTTASSASPKLPSHTSASSVLKSPSTVKTISSIPIATASTVPADKKNTLNKPKSLISNNSKQPSSTVKEPSAASDKRSTVRTTPSVHVVATSSETTATKSTTQSDVKPGENIKDSKGS